MRATWHTATDPQGVPLPGEHIGEIRGEPDFRLFANKYAWRVEIKGVVARSVITESHALDRAARRRGHPIDPVDYGMEQADAWACSVIDKRDAEVEGEVR